MRSLRRYLLAWLLGALTLGAGMLLAGAYWIALTELNEVFDRHLREIALSALAHFHESLSPSPQTTPRELEFVTQVSTVTGTLLFSSNRKFYLPLQRTQGYRTETIEKMRFRIYTLASPIFAVQAAQPLEVRKTLAANSASRLIIPILVAFPVIAGFLVYALRRGLSPLERATHEIEQRSAVSLDPIAPEAFPEEMRPTVESINRLLDRLGVALARQQQFVADAAHELRTPITAQRLQLQLLERAPSDAARAEATATLRQGIDRAQHLIEQLLELSRLAPENPSQVTEPVELAALVRTVVADFSQRAELAGIDLGANAEVTGHVLGDADQIRVLLNNLVSNALRYTPSGGTVDVVCQVEPGQVSLRVIDTGPGIPAPERDRVFDRFYRGSGAQLAEHSGNGSGLGLAIVKAIAERHGAAIELADSDSGGLSVSVRFERVV
ncbi:MAG: sensor histidine kinase [Thiotrichales bacterium]